MGDMTPALNGFTFVGGVRFPDCGVNIGVGVKLIGENGSVEFGVMGVGRLGLMAWLGPS
jgi:hypothetical protein